MLSFHQKRQLRKIYASRVMHIVLLVLCGAMAWSAYGRYAIARDMTAKRLTVEAEVRELEARRAALAEQVAYITSGRGIEAEMRRQFDIAREGEQVVIILDEPKGEE